MAQSNFLSHFILLLASIVVLLGTPQALGEAKALTERELILRDAQMIAGDEQKSIVAIDDLKKRPRKKVLEVLRSQLVVEGKSEEPSASVLRAFVAIEAVEVLPELADLVSNTESWNLILAVNKLALHPKARDSDRNKVSQLYLSRLAQGGSAIPKIAVLEGLAKFGTSISQPLFLTLIQDENYELRSAAFDHFLVTNAKLGDPDQAERYRRALTSKPYQLRLHAIHSFSKLAESRKKRLSELAKLSEICKNESNDEVKSACDKLAGAASSASSGGKAPASAQLPSKGAAETGGSGQ